MIKTFTSLRSGKGNSEKGNVFTVLLAAIGLAGVLGVATYNMMAGPYASMSRISGINATKSDMMTAGKIIAMSSLSNANAGDCDSDGAVEPPQWRAGTAGNVPTGGGLVPNTIGIPVINDAWGTPMGYCAWDTVTVNAAGCGGAGGLYLDGSPNPTTGNTNSQTVMAVISAGPDRRFQSTCAAYVDGTTSVLTQSGDDIAMPFSYAEAANSTSSLWKTKSGDTSTVQIDKNIEIGSNASVSSTGMGSFLAVNSTGAITVADQTQVGTAASATCDVGNTGLVKYVAAGGTPTYATPAIVQVAPLGTSYCSPCSSRTNSFSTLPTAGNTVVVMVAGTGNGSVVFPSGSATVTDNQGNTYSLVKASSQPGVWSTNVAFYAAYNIGSPTGTFTVTVTTATSHDLSIRAFEVSGLATTSATDANGTNYTNSNTTLTATTTGATTQATELALAAVSTTNVLSSIVSTSGWSLVNYPGTAPFAEYEIRYKNLTSTGSVSHQWTNGSAIDMSAIVATFKAAQTGSSTPAALNACDGSSWVTVGGSGGTPSDGLWTANSTTNIYPTTSTQSISIGSSTLLKGASAGTVLSIASNAGNDALVSMNTDCGATCFPTLNTYRARGSTGSLSAVQSGDLLSLVNFNGYLSGLKSLAKIEARAATPTILPTTALVQATTVASDSTSTTSSNSFSATPIAGNGIVVAVSLWRTSTSLTLTTGSISDNQGGSYTLAATGTTIGNATMGYSKTYVFYRTNLPSYSGTFTITLNVGGTSAVIAWQALEVSGLATASTVDTAMTTEGTTATSGATTTTVTASTATSQADMFIISVHNHDDDNNNTSYNCNISTSSSNWVTDGVQSNGNSSEMPFGLAHLITTSTQTPSITWNHSAHSTNGSSKALVVGFKAATASASSVIGTQVNFYTSSNSGTLSNTMRIDPSGNVGLGTTTPSEVLDVVSAPAQAAIDTYTTTANEGAVYSALRSRASGAVTQGGDIASYVDFTGYDTNSYETVARIAHSVLSTGTPTTNNMPMVTSFYTGTSTSGLAKRMEIGPVGYVGFGGNSNPLTRMDVDGLFLIYATGGVRSSAARAITGAGKRLIFDAYNTMFFCCEVTSTNATYMNAGSPEYTLGSVFLGTDLKSANSNGNLLIGYNQTALGSSAVDAVLIGEQNSAAGGGPIVGYTNSNPASGNGKITIGSNNSNSSTAQACIGGTLTCNGNHGIALGSYGTLGSGVSASLIGMGSSGAAAFTNSTSGYLQIGGTSAARWGIGTVTPSYTLQVVGPVGNNLSANWTNVSDRRLKDISGKYDRGLDDIAKLQPVMFHYKKDNPQGLPSDAQQIGFIAQDVRRVFPETVSVRKDGYLDFDMHSINVAMVSALSELQDRNQKIADKNAQWRERNRDLKAALDKLENEIITLHSMPVAENGHKTGYLGWLIPIGLILAAGGIAYRRKGGSA